MAAAVNNVSFDGSTVQFRMDSPLLACFDPLALDLLGELLPPGSPMDVSAFLERGNANNASLACLTIPDFRPGLYALDPRDIKKFGDEDEGLDYSEGEPQTDDGAPDYLFAGVDSELDSCGCGAPAEAGDPVDVGAIRSLVGRRHSFPRRHRTTSRPVLRSDRVGCSTGDAV